MTNLIPLPVYPSKPSGELLDMIKEAKGLINTRTMVQPVRAVHGSPGRVLAIGQRPDWICEYAYIEEPSVKSIKEAMEWILGIKEDPRGMTIIRVMREIFGPGVKDVTAEYVEQGAKA
jgi:hypothetical protein